MTAEMVLEHFESLSPEEKQKVQEFIIHYQEERSLPTAARIPNLHPDSMIMASDFDAPLPEEFWAKEL